MAGAYPERELHLVMDNYAAHKHPNVSDWLAANPRIHIHYTPFIWTTPADQVLDKGQT